TGATNGVADSGPGSRPPPPQSARVRHELEGDGCAGVAEVTVAPGPHAGWHMAEARSAARAGPISARTTRPAATSVTSAATRGRETVGITTIEVYGRRPATDVRPTHRSTVSTSSSPVVARTLATPCEGDRRIRSAPSAR